MKARAWAVALSVLLVLGLFFVGTVSAQGPGGQGPLDEDGDGVCDVCGGEGYDGAPRLGMRGPMHGRGGAAPMGGMWGGVSLIGSAAETLDVEVSEITALLADGKSLREAIIELGGDPEAVVSAFVAERQGGAR